ncbi:Na+/H+ antiporter subunit E [Thiorhodococcus fuscus]|uniref:Na+/H+ antiporter subunit E n=1 Tax=Thiorhodococcus fuscus TaxID=527200 RepID=A0ABW4YAQ1_9GAMM
MMAWLRFPLTTLALLALWLLLVGSVGPGQVLLGALLAMLITGATAGFWPRRRRPGRPWLILRYLWRLATDILTANVRVAALVLDRRRRPRPFFVEVPLALVDPFAIYLFASTVSLTPGTVSADLRRPADGGRTLLLVHSLDGGDAADASERLCRDLKQRYEQPLMEIFR